MLIVKPTCNKYALSNLNATDYSQMARKYSSAKKYGLRGVFTFASFAGVFGVVRDIAKGVVINYGKRKFAAVVLNGALYICSPAVIVFTNATSIVKTATRVHTFSSFIFECVEDTGNVLFLPFDFALFGQPIPVGEDGRFDIINNTTDFLE
jgi:hypothetical protein